MAGTVWSDRSRAQQDHTWQPQQRAGRPAAATLGGALDVRRAWPLSIVPRDRHRCSFFCFIPRDALGIECAHDVLGPWGNGTIAGWLTAGASWVRWGAQGLDVVPRRCSAPGSPFACWSSLIRRWRMVFASHEDCGRLESRDLGNTAALVMAWHGNKMESSSSSVTSVCYNAKTLEQLCARLLSS